MKIKLTKQEKNWILYDVGNSAFTLLAATILPIYFNYIAGKQGLSDVQYLAYWGYAVSIATLLTALAGPVFGTVADTKGYKKPVFTIALGIGAIASVALGFAKYWLAFLVVFVIAKVGYSVTLVFYDSMLVDVTLEDRMDEGVPVNAEMMQQMAARMGTQGAAGTTITTAAEPVQAPQQVVIPRAQLEDLNLIRQDWGKIIREQGGSIRPSFRDTVLEPSGDSCLCIVFSNSDNYAIGSRPTVLGALEKYIEEQYGKTMYFKARMRNAGERLNTIYVSDEELKNAIHMDITIED